MHLVDVADTSRSQEKTYNPYYTLVAHRMGTKSHSFQITLQYCLWDFLRELGEKTVGGEELVKTITDDGALAKVSARRVSNLAKLYAWCVAKDVLSMAIFKVSLLISLRVLSLTGIVRSPSPLPVLVLKPSSSFASSSPPSSSPLNLPLPLLFKRRQGLDGTAKRSNASLSRRRRSRPWSRDCCTSWKRGWTRRTRGGRRSRA